jgi:hypothetical protein
MIDRNRFLQALIFAAGAALTTAPLHAQDMDVDQADSLDFGAFHKDKKEAVKAWKKDTSGPTKAYQDSADGNAAKADAAATTAPAAAPAAAASSAQAATQPAAAAAEPGKRFEIRERYTLTRSAKTPYSAFYVIEPLYKQSAQLCPKGWKKLSERSEPVEQDFFLYYVIECL